MKRLLCIALAACLLLCGCRSTGPTPGETENQTEALTENMTENTTQNPTEEATENATAVEFVEIETQDVTLPAIGEEPTDETGPMGQTGCVRVGYSGNVSSVRYVTSAEQLPDNDALAAYDEAYFETKALVVVMETVSSGSIRVGIESIENGVVTLSHEMPGQVGTADMATWLLWAEVDAGLDCTWSVANPAVEPNTSSY